MEIVGSAWRLASDYSVVGGMGIAAVQKGRSAYMSEFPGQNWIDNAETNSNGAREIDAEGIVKPIAAVEASARVLVIDDSFAVVSTLAHFLRSEGFTPIEAHSGEEGLAKLKQDGADVILVDLMMPGTNGFDVVRAVRGNSETANIPIIMITARQDEETRAEGQRLGVTDFLTKPMFPKQLAKKIRAQLNIEVPGKRISAQVETKSFKPYVSFRRALHQQVWSESWSVQFMRPGLLLIALFELASIGSAAILFPNLARRHLPFEVFNAVAAFACLWFMWTSRFKSRWRETVFAFSFLILIAASFVSITTSRSEPLVMAIILLMFGGGSLIPWNARWQTGLTLLCLGWFVGNAIWLPNVTSDGIDRWLALLAAAGLAQVGTARNEHQRQEYASEVVFTDRQES
jgi:CheY-like chemotaxis protein